MRFTDKELEEFIEDAEEEVRSKARYWSENKVPIDGVTNVLYAASKAVRQLASTAILMRAVTQARDWFGMAGHLRYTRVQEGRLRRDIRERNVWEREPRVFSRALTDALLSHNNELLSEIARDAVRMDESYIDEFAADYADYPAYYYNAKAKAALAMEDERAAEFIEQLNDAIDRLDDPSAFWTGVAAFYRAIDNENREAAQSAAETLLEYYTDKTPNPEDPAEFVLHSMCALLYLAYRRGVLVKLESDRLPEGLVTEAIPDNERRLDIDVSELEFSSPVGLFELERGDDGSPIILGRIYHPGHEPVSADDVPERAVGTVLSDEWIEAALDEAEWRSHYDTDLVSEARTAHEEGKLRRKLVVVQDRTDEYTFDETLAKVSVDEIEILKGAGKK